VSFKGHVSGVKRKVDCEGTKEGRKEGRAQGVQDGVVAGARAILDNLSILRHATFPLILAYSQILSRIECRPYPFPEDGYFHVVIAQRGGFEVGSRLSTPLKVRTIPNKTRKYVVSNGPPALCRRPLRPSAQLLYSVISL
jgi:hypothetical protein